MCTSACTTALYAYRSGVASACGSYMITDPFDGSLYPGPYLSFFSYVPAMTTSSSNDCRGHCVSGL
jgi:hypothetical protein